MASKRLQIPFIGEYYYDELVIEARLKARTEVAEAASLICSKLMQRKDIRNEMIEQLAKKRKIGFDEMRRIILSGEPLEPEEILVQTEPQQ
jgi:hypothetical protein